MVSQAFAFIGLACCGPAKNGKLPFRDALTTVREVEEIEIKTRSVRKIIKKLKNRRRSKKIDEM